MGFALEGVKQAANARKKNAAIRRAEQIENGVAR